MIVRAERPEDRAAVRAVHLAAFETNAEADLVDALRDQASPVVSLVAENDRGIVGHILFTPVTLNGDPELCFMGLAPMAVSPRHQNKGIGSALVRAGLDRCSEIGVGAVVVLGHPSFYPRFGFLPAARFGIRSEYGVPEEAFMLLQLQRDALRGASGTARFHPAFANV